MRPLSLAVLFAVLACKAPPPPGPPPAVSSTEEAETPSPDDTASAPADGALPWPTPTECAASGAEVEAIVVEDLRTIVGGYFAVDHIGAEAFAAIEARVEAAPDAYLDAWAQQAFGPASRADAHWANLLTRTAELRPARTRALARCQSDHLDGIIASPPADRDPDWASRVQEQQRALYQRWRGVALDDTKRLAQPLRVCHDGNTLTVEVDCTCGEPVVCEVAPGPGTLDVLVTLDLTGAVMCRDCYAATGTCTLPASVGTGSSALTLNGRALPITPCPLP